MQRQTHMLNKVIKHWQHIAPVVCVPKNEKDFAKLASRLDELLDTVGNDDAHPLMSLIDVVSNIIENYEHQKYLRKPRGKGIAALKFLMQSHNLTQKSFPEIATQGVMSEILNGRRKLNLRQIKLLAKRFRVSPETFID
jgi:HTH-type transcriptional regulator/antitoxin HigA